ncbi:MAG: KamA family protein [Bacteroidales bacterium]|jgi:lysine 2,3-aminomutase|nr:KamA family protein [Bacteroidales bacterium]
MNKQLKNNPKSHQIILQLLEENPKIKFLISESESHQEFINKIKIFINKELDNNTALKLYYDKKVTGKKAYEQISWRDHAIIRILDYIDNAELEYIDLNLRGENGISNPFKLLWQAIKYGKSEANYMFFMDMLELFRQFSNNTNFQKPDKEKVLSWMDNHPSGLDNDIIKIREQNKRRIINVFIELIDSGEIKSSIYSFETGMSKDDKFNKMLEWWETIAFHLKFAIRNPKLLNRMLDFSLDEKTMQVLYKAESTGIPFFVNPYYLSLLNINKLDNYIGSDYTIRDYIIYSQELVNEYGNIVAWEKEDIVEAGKPNAAGWLVPEGHNIHRRYPEVAILIPDSMGRTCAGLCTSCQRMYDFQSGHLNFNLEKLKPKETWPEKLKRLMKYFEEDSQLRDILITGGDAFMSSDKSLTKILDAVYNTAVNKKKANEKRDKGNKYAEMLRVRLGTRIPVYLPQRINDDLIEVLANFKEKGSKIGIKQFIIQTHIESAMEITPRVKAGIEKLSSAGWTIINQQVFTTAASRRGHSTKLRKVLNDIGILSYYTFSVKGYMENTNNFATNARAVQEQIEEKYIGKIPARQYDKIKTFPEDAKNILSNISKLKKEENIPFLATDRNILNLPGVGKSSTFRTIGITKHGRRILEFSHDTNRKHSPIIHKMGKVIIVESKPIAKYLEQLEEMGEDINNYKNVWGYSIGETEERMSIYEYPNYDFENTEEITNLEI